MKKALLWLFIVRSFVVSIFGAQEVSFPELTTEKKESVREAKVIDIANILEPIAKRYDIPSIAGLLMKGDKIVMQGVVGIRTKGSNTQTTFNDLWHIGSCTKSLTATLCAILVEKNILKWDLTLGEVFPELENKMNDEFKNVTLSQLLTNRGGFPGDLASYKSLWNGLWHFNGSPRSARRYLLEKIVERPPETKPGTRDVYSNAGFAVAGHVAETVAGKDYEELMKEHIFTPLKMNSAGWGAPGTWASNIQENVEVPWGHTQDGKPVIPLKNTPDGKGSDNPSAISPAGRLHCTIGDWAKYISIHLRGNEDNPFKKTQLLSGETFKKLQTPPDELSDYAYGWICCHRDWAGLEGGNNVLTHAGSNTMWYSVTRIAPRKDFAVLVCCNLGGSSAEKGTNEAIWAITQKYLENEKPESATNPQ